MNTYLYFYTFFMFFCEIIYYFANSFCVNAYLLLLSTLDLSSAGLHIQLFVSIYMFFDVLTRNMPSLWLGQVRFQLFSRFVCCRSSCWGFWLRVLHDYAHWYEFQVCLSVRGDNVCARPCVFEENNVNMCCLRTLRIEIYKCL